MTAKQIMDKPRENGWTLNRINGSHHVFIKAGRRPVSVPFHGNRDIENLAKRILKEAGIEQEGI
jgi:predicted RNA binding protein YcfA (HicA-like mRNA interferase family)